MTMFNIIFSMTIIIFFIIIITWSHMCHGNLLKRPFDFGVSLLGSSYLDFRVSPLRSSKTCTIVIIVVMMIVMKNLLEKSTAPPLFSHHTLLGCTLLGPPDQKHGDEVDEVDELNLIFADYTLY